MSGKKKKFTNYIVIQPWMFSNLQLSGNEAIVFAIVYGFSQDGKSWYRGGSYYIEQTTPFTQRTAKTHLWTLEKMGVIEMRKETVNGVERNIYRATPGVEEMILPTRKPTRGQPDNPGKDFTRENFSPVKNTSENPGKIFTQTREKFSRKKSIEKSIGKSIYQREAPKQDRLMESSPDRETVEETFREVLDLDKQKQRCDPALLEELLALIVEMYCCPDQVQYIGKVPYATVCVRKMLDKMDGTHIEYIMESLAKASLPIRNVRAYLQTVILRATATNEFYWMTKSEDTCAKQSSAQALPAIDMAAAATSRRLRKGGGST